MSKGGIVLTVIAIVIIWKAPAAAGHFVLETWDKASTFIGTIFR